MLRDVFPCLLKEGEIIESATIWESSRICAVASTGQPERMKNGIGYVLSELITGLAEVAILAGLTEVVSVFDARIFRMLKAAVCEPCIIGRPRRIGDVMAYAGLFQAGPKRLETLRASLGIDGSVLAPNAKELVFP